MQQFSATGRAVQRSGLNCSACCGEQLAALLLFTSEEKRGDLKFVTVLHCVDGQVVLILNVKRF